MQTSSGKPDRRREELWGGEDEEVRKENVKGAFTGREKGKNTRYNGWGRSYMGLRRTYTHVMMFMRKRRPGKERRRGGAGRWVGGE